MFGQVGVLITLVVLTIVLAGVFLLRPAVTVGATGKILAFVGLCILPTLCIGAGMSFHMQRSQQTAYCVSCHSMETHGQSLYLLSASYIPAQHFQNHLVPPNQACYTCHTDYTMYGPLKDKIKGLRYLYMEYVSTPPKTIHLDGTYSNLQCLHCHEGMRSFDENPAHTAIMGSLKTNRISCISCHDMIHNASEVGHLKMWVDGDVPATAAAGPSSSAPAEPTTGPSKAPAGGSTAGASTAQGKSIFDSQGCAGCHGDAGAGGPGPALTQTSSQYPPAQLTAVLKAPTEKMKAAGMVPLTVNAADMKALVSYVTSLGGTPVATVAKTPAAGSSSPAPAKGEPAATAGPSKAPASPVASNASTAEGKAIYDSQHCSGCHGEAGAGGPGPALTHTSSQYPPAQLTAVLKAPTEKMKAAGMVPLMVNAADMEALVAYVSGFGGTSVASAAPPSAVSPSAGSAAAEPSATAEAPAGSPAGDATAVKGKSTAPGLSASAPVAAAPIATDAPSKPESKGRSVLRWISVFLPYPHEAPPPAESAVPAKTTTGRSNAPNGGSAVDAGAAQGKSIFDAQGCAGCHGVAGAGGPGPALTHTSSQYTAARLTAVLKAPTEKMKAAGMVPVTVNAADMKALVTYVTSLGGTSVASATKTPAARSPLSAPAKAEPAVTAGGRP